MSKPYISMRAKAWRNAMVAAINAGIEQGIFTMKPGENLWPPNVDKYGNRFAHVFHFTYDDVPAVASVSDAGWDELSIHVALWPKEDADRGVVAALGNFGSHSPGALFATGWVERREGAWLQRSPTQVFCKKDKLPVVSTWAIEPKGYTDNGQFIL